MLPPLSKLGSSKIRGNSFHSNSNPNNNDESREEQPSMLNKTLKELIRPPTSK